MKKIVVFIALTVAANTFACGRNYCGSSRGVRLAGDIIRLVDRGLTVLDRHACYAPPVQVAYVPTATMISAPVAAQPVAAAVEPAPAMVTAPAAPAVVNVQYVYPHRRSLHYQTPGNIPPQRGLVYIQ